MGLKSVLKFLTYRLTELTLIILVIVFLPNLPPKADISESYSLPPFKPLTGKLAINNKLDDVEIWHKGDLHGPEVIIDHKGDLYTGLLGGDVVKLVGKDHIVPVVKFGKPCAHYYEEHLCGRPLGLEFDKDGYLYAMDAYYGLWKANVETGEKTLLIGPNEEIDGKVPKIFNSIAIASNGDIYFSHSSSQFDLHDGVFDMLADPSGRLIRYDPKTKTKTVLIDKLAFANGVVLSDDEEFVLVAETLKCRVLRYYLKGPKKGTYDIFIDALPGITDNLSRDGKGGFLVPLVISTDEDHPMFNHIISPFPLVRRLFARLFGIAEWMFKNIDKYYPNEFAKRAVFHIGHFTSIPDIVFVKRTTLVRLSKNGEIIDSVHTLNSKISYLCDAYIYKDTLYLGSFRNDYIAKIPLSKIGWEDLKTEIREKRDTKPLESPKSVPAVQDNIQKKQAPKVQTVTAELPKKAPENQKPTQPKVTTAPPVKQETVAPQKTQQTTPPPNRQETQKQSQTSKQNIQSPKQEQVTNTKQPSTTTPKPQRQEDTPTISKTQTGTQKVTEGSSKQAPPAGASQKVESKPQKTQTGNPSKVRHTATQKPQATQEKPQVAKQAPQVKPEATRRTETATQKPETIQQKPEQVTQKPQQAAQKPQQETKKPDQAAQKPQQAIHEPKQASQKPQQASQKPQQASQEPQQVSTKHQQASAKPQQASATPQQASAKPQQASQKPQTAQQNSEVKSEDKSRQAEKVPQKSQATQQKSKPEQQTQKPQAAQNKAQPVPQKPQSAPPKASPTQIPASPSKQPPPVAQPVKEQFNDIPINNGPKK